MIQVSSARFADLAYVAQHLRVEEQIEFEELGSTPFRFMRDLYMQTHDARTAFADGRILAIWGDSAPPVSFEGLPWLFTTTYIEEHKVGFARIAKREVARMLEYRQSLRASAHVKCERSIRFWLSLGFWVADQRRPGFIDLVIGL